MPPKLIIISGPTATGKSSLALDLAKKYELAIVNFDSLCFYRELSIGTAKPSQEEQAQAPHFMIDVASISNPLNAADFVKMARPLMDQLFQEYKALILVGGSGFYLRALLEGMYESETTPPDILEKSETLYQQKGILPFWTELQQCDPVAAKKLHPNDHYRIRRAVEHFWAHGNAFSAMASNLEKQKETDIPHWETLHLYLDLPKNIHQEIIIQRAQKMWDQGLIAEVGRLLQQGFSGEERPLGAIGYKEAIGFLRGELETKEACLEKIVISTRQLAKSQRTWFKKVSSKITINPLQEKNKCTELVGNFLAHKKG